MNRDAVVTEAKRFEPVTSDELIEPMAGTVLRNSQHDAHGDARR